MEQNEMQAKNKPYELLVRWDQAGKLLGAHVQWSTVVTDESGVLIGSYPGNIEPIALTDGQAGFPVSDILSQALTDALTALTAEQQKSASLEEQLGAATAQVTQLQATAAPAAGTAVRL